MKQGSKARRSRNRRASKTSHPAGCSTLANRKAHAARGDAPVEVARVIVRSTSGLARRPRNRRVDAVVHARSRIRTDAMRRTRMRRLDRNSPMRPSGTDLIVGKAAERELERIKRDGK